MKRLVVTIGVVLFTTACGPVESTAVLIDAEAAVAGARTAGASDAAPYEFTSAELYLEKAYEERGYADFEIAVDYARKAREFARQAQAKSVKKTRIEGEDASKGSDLPPPPVGLP